MKLFNTIIDQMLGFNVMLAELRGVFFFLNMDEIKKSLPFVMNLK